MTAGWRVAAACAVALLAVPVLVIWRSTHLDGGWLLALRLTGALAVLGLVAACWLAVRLVTPVTSADAAAGPDDAAPGSDDAVPDEGAPPAGDGSAEPPAAGETAEPEPPVAPGPAAGAGAAAGAAKAGKRELLLRVEPGRYGPHTTVVSGQGAAAAPGAAGASPPGGDPPPPPGPPPAGQPPAGGGPLVDPRALRRAVGVALAAVLPVLLVIVLAVPAEAEPAGTAGPAPGVIETPSAATPSASGVPPPAPSVTTAPTATAPTATAPTATSPTATSPTATPPTATPPTATPPPAGAPPGTGSPPDSTPEPATCSVTVQAGDTLWGLAEQHLGPGATDAEIDAGWRADYAANAGVVGPDPNLITPGLQLSLPCG